MKPWFYDGIAHGFSKLGNNGLLRFIHNKSGREENDQPKNNDGPNDHGGCLIHFFCPPCRIEIKAKCPQLRYL